MRNEYAKRKRAVPRKAPEFVLLDNMSNKINQIEKRICSLQHENKEIRESIMDLRIFLKQYKKFEKEFREKIGDMTDEAQMHLDRAVSTYEEREECINRRNIYRDRCSQDLRKAAINENALNLILEKTQKFEDFGELQKKRRSDSRIATTGGLIEQGITGLEPQLTRVQNLHSAIVESSGKATPQEMDEHIKLTDDQANSKFSYLEELLEMIHRTQNTIDELKEKNRELLMGLSNQEKRLRWEIGEAQLKAKESKAEADASIENMNEARAELDNLLEKVHSLYLKCGSEEMTIPSAEQKKEAEISEIPQMQGIENQEINDSNALDFNEKVEKKILEYLMLIEYIRMKESVQEETPIRLAGADEDELSIEEPPKVEYLDTIQPRRLKSKPDLHCISDMYREDVVLPLDQLKSKAVTAVAEIESGESTEDDDLTAQRKGKKKD
ncbi:hypothetical protein HNY73_003096 [Argiope bruennichi]|uniref:ODAD1 central coiled coil region domain-containing protein n=1 Tax=Argiope bruennichi TaxID=94029 RepID=A0A8T0G1X5_ARGBR|nr:hypothetical protein HNY73_003096 [Argiope bruennichi]